jgi:hypothetical protein
MPALGRSVCLCVPIRMGSSAPAASLLVCGLAGALDVFTAVSRDGPPKQSAPVAPLAGPCSADRGPPVGVGCAAVRMRMNETAFRVLGVCTGRPTGPAMGFA